MFHISGLEHTKHPCIEVSMVKPQHSTVNGAQKIKSRKMQCRIIARSLRRLGPACVISAVNSGVSSGSRAAGSRYSIFPTKAWYHLVVDIYFVLTINGIIIGLTGTYGTTAVTSVTFFLPWGLFCLAQSREDEARKIHLPPHFLMGSGFPTRPCPQYLHPIF